MVPRLSRFQMKWQLETRKGDEFQLLTIITKIQVYVTCWLILVFIYNNSQRSAQVRRWSMEASIYHGNFTSATVPIVIRGLNEVQALGFICFYKVCFCDSELKPVDPANILTFDK